MQQGGSQYGVPPPPEMAPFGVSRGAGTRPQVLRIPGSDQLQQQQPQQPVAEAASPISSRQPPVSAQPSNFEELVSTGNYADDDAFAGGEEAERGPPGNRWPRQETLALIEIRSDMDATFRDATLKGPLWEEVSRKLAEQGYTRSAKKCKEKFENVHKYYKRTKEKCGGRQDGKSYRFFSQLEALHSGSSSSAAALPSPTSAAPNIASTTTTTTPNPSVFGMTGRIQQPTPLSSIAPPGSAPRPASDPMAVPGLLSAAGGGLSFSSNTSSPSSSESDGEETDEGQRKRKRRSSEGGGSRKMMSFFQGLMQQVMEKQEAMQQRFLETIEKRDQDRMIREEAWRRQEMARITREHEMMEQDRATSASRDASIIAFLQKITGQTIQLPQPISITVVPTTSTSMPTPPPPQQQQPAQPIATPPPPQQQQQKQKTPSLPLQQQRPETTPGPPSSSKLVQFQEQNQELGASGSTDPASSRWPKSEVHALIKLRSGLELRYQDAGPKGPLWEEISSEMKKLGYNRNAKRCKEKWENINKYFKKVKESNKKRPEDAKTCPYFHQLDALYRKKILSGGSGSQNKQENEAPAAAQSSETVVDAQQNKIADDENNRNGGGNGNGRGGMQTTNGGLPTSFFEEGAGTAVSSGGETKKPESIVRDYDKMEMDQATDSDNLDDDGDDEEDEEEQKMAYTIEFQRPTAKSSNGANSSVATAAATTAGSFLAMVQ